MKSKKEANELKHAQQHLANERTYLAWIRTAVAIIGIGFLGAHFAIGNGEHVKDRFLVLLFEGFTEGIGIFIIVTATASYLRKKKQIEHQTFQSSRLSILFISVFLIAITLLMVYFLLSNLGTAEPFKNA